jgi:sirohydrochlorin ferrochelatase
VPNAADSMLLVATALARCHGHGRVEVCFMSRLGPHFPETFARCVAEGARQVIVVPYFLHGGLHIELDIPEMLKACAVAHPEVRLILGDRLGYDECFVDVLERRIRDAASRPDIRAVELPPRDRFPIPAGQDELVPMSPALAARWRATVKDHDSHAD